VPVSINDAPRLTTLSVSITFNPSLVRVRSVQEGSFMRQGGVSAAFNQQVDPTAGRVDITLTRGQDMVGASGTGLIAALLVDAVALAAIAARISEFGFTPNRVAALGENLILLVNLAGSAWLYARFLRQQNPFGALERWQVLYLPVYSLWAALVVIVFPLVFGYR